MEIGPRQPALDLFLGRLEGRSRLVEAEKGAVRALQGQPQTVLAHRDLIRLDDHASCAYLVVNGLLASYVQLEDGSRQTVALHIPGDMVGIQSLLLPASAPFLHALTDTTVLKVSHDTLLQLIAEHCGLAAALWRDCATDNSIVAQWLVNVGRKNARSRLAHLICEMAIRYDMVGQLAGGTFSFPMTQEQMADAVGLTAVHVNRSIRSLREDGLIRWSRMRVTIVDWEALATAGEFSPRYLHTRVSPGAAIALSHAQVH